LVITGKAYHLRILGVVVGEHLKIALIFKEMTK